MIPPAFDGTRGFFNERTPLYGVNLPAVRNAWSFSGDGELNLTPIVAGGTVYVVSDSGKIFGVDEGTGSETWQAQVRNLGAPGAMAAGGGVLVVAGSDGYSGILGLHVLARRRRRGLDWPRSGRGFGRARDCLGGRVGAGGHRPRPDERLLDQLQ